MTNPKGTRAETALVNYARVNGFEQADRIPRKGRRDEGDVWLIPRSVMVEVKNVPSKYSPTKTPEAWIAETLVEQVNSGADIALLICKPAGVGFFGDRPGDWHAWIHDYLGFTDSLRGDYPTPGPGLPARMLVRDAFTLLRWGGYGGPLIL